MEERGKQEDNSTVQRSLNTFPTRLAWNASARQTAFSDLHVVNRCRCIALRYSTIKLPDLAYAHLKQETSVILAHHSLSSRCLFLQVSDITIVIDIAGILI